MITSDMLAKYHDAELLNLLIDRQEKQVVLRYRTTDKKTGSIIFEDVVSFRLTDIIFQNIVSRLTISLRKSIKRQEILQWVMWINNLGDNKMMIKGEAVNQYVEQIGRDDLLLLIIEPSWGAEGAVICKKIHLEETA